MEEIYKYNEFFLDSIVSLNENSDKRITKTEILNQMMNTDKTNKLVNLAHYEEEYLKLNLEIYQIHTVFDHYLLSQIKEISYTSNIYQNIVFNNDNLITESKYYVDFSLYVENLGKLIGNTISKILKLDIENERFEKNITFIDENISFKNRNNNELNFIDDYYENINSKKIEEKSVCKKSDNYEESDSKSKKNDNKYRILVISILVLSGISIIVLIFYFIYKKD